MSHAPVYPCTGLLVGIPVVVKGKIEISFTFLIALSYR